MPPCTFAKRTAQKTVELLEKEERVSMDYRVDTTSQTMLIRWNDNRNHTVAPTAHEVTPRKKAKRWSAQIKATDGMDGMDENIGTIGPKFLSRNGSGQSLCLQCKLLFTLLGNYPEVA